jgi:hypothetical protein
MLHAQTNIHVQATHNYNPGLHPDPSHFIVAEDSLSTNCGLSNTV